MSEQDNPDEIKPANQRGSARLGAVQALYQMDVGGTALEIILREFAQVRLGQEVAGDTYRTADIDYFNLIVRGVVENQTKIDPVIDTALVDRWPLTRIDTTLRAILRCGCFELIKRGDVPAKVVVSEYVDIAKAFYADGEAKMVNAVLDNIAKQARATELKN